jgi:hypothetical protein
MDIIDRIIDAQVSTINPGAGRILTAALEAAQDAANSGEGDDEQVKAAIHGASNFIEWGDGGDLDDDEIADAAAKANAADLRQLADAIRQYVGAGE